MQVTFTSKDGSEKRMPIKHAEILRKLGKGSYSTPGKPGDAEPAKAPEQPRARPRKGVTKT